MIQTVCTHSLRARNWSPDIWLFHKLHSASLRKKWFVQGQVTRSGRVRIPSSFPSPVPFSFQSPKNWVFMIFLQSPDHRHRKALSWFLKVWNISLAFAFSTSGWPCMSRFEVESVFCIHGLIRAALPQLPKPSTAKLKEQFWGWSIHGAASCVQQQPASAQAFGVRRSVLPHKHLKPFNHWKHKELAMA